MSVGITCSHRAPAVVDRAFCVLVACALIGGSPTSALHAQDAPPSAWARANDPNGAGSSGTAPWLGAWSPLRPIVDIARGLLRAPLSPGLLDAPAPMAGAFLLAGAPGALARDMQPHLASDTTRFGEIRLRMASERGEYKRPLDMIESDVSQVSGMGWSPVGKRGIAIGRFVIDQETNDSSSGAERVSPYWASPFIVTSAVAPPMRRIRARLEGALSLRLGGFGAGISAGIDSREHSSFNFPLRRNGRAATPGLALGLDRSLPWLGLRVGAYYRWAEPNETSGLNPTSGGTYSNSLQGYDEPVDVPVQPLQPPPLFARIDRRATAVGATAELMVLDTRIVVTHENGDRAEDQYRTIAAVTGRDRWRAKGDETRLQLQRALGSRGRATIVGSRESLDGNAVRFDLRGIAFIADESKSAVEADVRMKLTTNWSAAVTGGATSVNSIRTDFVQLIESDVDATTPFFAGEVARTFGQTALSLGASTAFTSPSGSVPAAERGPNYKRLIAPDLAYQLAEARATAFWLTATTRVRTKTAIVSFRSERASPATVVAKRLQPDGDRSGWSLMIGLRP